MLVRLSFQANKHAISYNHAYCHCGGFIVDTLDHVDKIRGNLKAL